MNSEVLTTGLAFFGRVADDLTRRVLRPEQVTVSLDGDRRPVLRKDDGHFAFVGVEPSAADYRIRIGGPSFQPRTVTAALPTPAPVQVTLSGEDEFYVALSGPPAGQNRVNFEPVAFLPPVEAGASVIGPGSFTTTLVEPLEGQDVAFAMLGASAGLAAGQVLRIVRSPNLLVRPGPYYPFPDDVTVVAVHVVEGGPAEPAIAGATVTITQIDGAGPTVVTIGGLALRRFTLTVNPTAFVVLDTDDRTTTTNERGDAVFYFGPSTALASLRMDVAKARYQTATVTLNVATKTRTFQKVSLTPV